MFTPRRTAQLGLCATCLVLISSLGILVAKAVVPDSNKSEVSSHHAAVAPQHSELSVSLSAVSDHR